MVIPAGVGAQEAACSREALVRAIQKGLLKGWREDGRYWTTRDEVQRFRAEREARRARRPGSTRA
jgi:hypothetical protein